MRPFLHYFSVSAMCFTSVIGNGQSLSPQVTASSGNYFSNSSGSLSWTIGEPIYETVVSQNNTLTQGFQQPTLVITPVVSERPNDELQINVFPNPSANFLSIQYASNKQLSGNLYDLSGKIIAEIKLPEGNLSSQIDFTALAEGTYILNFSNASGNIIKTFMVEKLK